MSSLYKKYARVIADHHAEYPDPIRVAAAEPVQVGREAPEFPGWKWYCSRGTLNLISIQCNRIALQSRHPPWTSSRYSRPSLTASSRNQTAGSLHTQATPTFRTLKLPAAWN